MASELLSSLLGAVDFEVIPLKGTVEKAAVIPAGSTVSVTASPSRGMAATVDLSVELQDRGYRAVPHLAARLIADRHELASMIKRLDDGGVTQVFIVGGDPEPRGDYVDALSLLRDLAELGHPFLEVGITGYPEGHPVIPDHLLHNALRDKQAYATYLVTQMCFNAPTIVDWVSRIRSDGIGLPIKVGVPGVIDPTRLVAIATRIGVGDSRRFLAKNYRTILRFLRPGRYRPDRLIKAVAGSGDGLGLTGLHLFTFNQVEPTVEWHARASERL